MELQELELKNELEKIFCSGSIIDNINPLLDNFANIPEDVKESIRQYLLKNNFVITFAYPFQYIEQPTIAINLVTENFIPMILGHRSTSGYAEEDSQQKIYTYTAVGGEKTIYIPHNSDEYLNQNTFVVYVNNDEYKFPESFNKKDYISYQYISGSIIQITKHGIPFKVLPDGIEFYDPLNNGDTIKIYYNTLKVHNAVTSRFLRKNFRISIYTNNELVTIVTYYIVKTILLTSFLNYLERTGGYDYTFDSTDLIVEEPMLPAGWYSRRIGLSFFVEEDLQLIPYIDEIYPTGSLPAGRENAVATLGVINNFKIS